MNTTKKMTKREKFTALLTHLSDLPEDTTFGEIDLSAMSEFVAHEIELLDKKNATKGERKPTAKQEQNIAIGEKIVEFLTECGEGKTCSQMLKEVEGLPEDMSLPRITHIVTALVNDDKVERYVEKRVAYFKAK